MGIITRSAANNITTGGVILPAGINDASVASITALAQVSAGDGITLISSQTASNSSSVSFTSGIDSTYRTYLFKFINIHTLLNTDGFRFNMSTDGGSNYNVIKTTTWFEAFHNESDSAYNFAYDSGNDLAQSSSDQLIIRSMKTDSDSNGSGYMYLFNPSSTTYVKHFISNCNNVQFEDYSQNYMMAGYANTTSAINAIIFRMGTGNFSGTIHMYGIA